MMGMAMACGAVAFKARCCVGLIDLDTVDRMAKALVASMLMFDERQ
jgi:hypothetical protein